MIVYPLHSFLCWYLSTTLCIASYSMLNVSQKIDQNQIVLKRLHIPIILIGGRFCQYKLLLHWLELGAEYILCTCCCLCLEHGPPWSSDEVFYSNLYKCFLSWSCWHSFFSALSHILLKFSCCFFIIFNFLLLCSFVIYFSLSH